MSKKTSLVFLWSGALAVVGLTGCASPAPAPNFASGNELSVQYACGNGERVEVQFFPKEGHSVLLRSGWKVGLPQLATTDYDYVYSNGLTTVQGKGNELTIQIAHLAPIWCRSSGAMTVASAR